jgi:AcrR family transcriptional regulator
MAPLPRFHKLEDEKRETILEVAAQEFLERGFDAASFNRIIERAGVSKGAMYYYFKDKSDLYNTVLDRLMDRVSEYIGVSGFDHLTRENFWPEMFKIQEKKVEFALAHPWVLRLWGVGLRLMKSDPSGALAGMYQRKMPLMLGWLERGRAVGAIRSDLDARTQLELVMAMGMVIGEHMLAGELDEAALRARSRVFLEMVQQALMPRDEVIGAAVDGGDVEGAG